MPKKKETILGKIVQKDYNNELEKVIETKDFDEEVKSLLLVILYKIDVSYKDYKQVKRNVESKQEYIERIIQIIQNSCNKIKIAKPNSEEGNELGEKTFFIDKQNKSIICYPVERKLLYSISKVGKQDKIIKDKHFLVDKTISNMINIGNNINTVEPLRYFNGWSWLIIKKEIENISYNLIYQNLRILVGEQFLNYWINNSDHIIDYYDELKNELSEKFGEALKNKIILLLEKLSILLELEINPEYEQLLKQLQEENNQKIHKFKDNKEFVENISDEKKQLNKEIKKIEKILSSKDLLEQEYTKLNKELPLDEKVFSIKILEQKLKVEKRSLLEQLKEKNKSLNPKKFVQEKTELEKMQELLQIIEIEDKNKEKEKILEEFQKLFLQCFLVFINTAETKDEIIDLIYIFRYYNLLPFNEKIDIYENKAIQRKLKETREKLLDKAIDYKVINTPSEEKEENIKLLQFIFKSKIISLEDVYITAIKEKNKYFVEFSEDNDDSYEEKFEIKSLKKENLNVKLDKKVKFFN